MNNVEYLKKYYQGDITSALERLEQGEPIQYIVGNVDFYHSNFKITKDVLIPRFETEELVDKTINYIKMYLKEPLNIVDLGTGSGCIAISIKKEIDCNMDAVDISKQALKIARMNAKENNVDINFYCGSFLEPLNKKYDVIISNPPYISYDEEIMDVVKNNEPALALYADNNGLACYEEILKNISKYLNDKSIIAFEIGYKQSDSIKNIVQNYLPNARISIEKDLQGKDRFIFILNL